jgi:hypothetical protein
MTITTILIYGIGTVIVQVAIAVIVNKLRHTGKPRRNVEADMVFVERKPPALALPSQTACRKTLAELSAILIALSPECEGTASREVSAERTNAESKPTGRCPEECPANPSPLETATDACEPATPTGSCVGFTLVNSARRPRVGRG